MTRAFSLAFPSRLLLLRPNPNRHHLQKSLCSNPNPLCRPRWSNRHSQTPAKTDCTILSRLQITPGLRSPRPIFLPLVSLLLPSLRTREEQPPRLPPHRHTHQCRPHLSLSSLPLPTKPLQPVPTWTVQAPPQHCRRPSQRDTRESTQHPSLPLPFLPTSSTALSLSSNPSHLLLSPPSDRLPPTMRRSSLSLLCSLSNSSSPLPPLRTRTTCRPPLTRGGGASPPIRSRTTLITPVHPSSNHSISPSSSCTTRTSQRPPRTPCLSISPGASPSNRQACSLPPPPQEATRRAGGRTLPPIPSNKGGRMQGAAPVAA
mmetsp:Transcript_11969/g.22989  ORF Transcript_11969/g.22989 Transcript_11969/m.22989 type:complete len:316 (+) Transcript_11969:658-1605(+)